MSKDASSAMTKETDEDIQREQKTAPPDASSRDERVLLPTEYQILDAIQRRVLWLCTLMIHQCTTRFSTS